MAQATPKSALPSAATVKLIKGKTLNIGLRPKVSAKDVHEAMEQIFRLSGCTDCGLNGFDIHLYEAVNPAIQQHFQTLNHLNGVQNVYVSESMG